MNASGARFAKITAQMAIPGSTSRTIRHARDLPLGRGRARRNFRREPESLFRALPMEWQRSHPERTPFRTDEWRRKPRRRCQRVLLLSGQHANDMKYLYKYPQSEFPYVDLVETNRRSSREELEYELLDTGVFDEDRHFDVFVEYAKETPKSILIRITIFNRGPESATLHVLPTLWFRNPCSWKEGGPRPVFQKVRTARGNWTICASHPGFGERFLHCDGPVDLLFTENEKNNERPFHAPNRTRYVKDGINDYSRSGKSL